MTAPKPRPHKYAAKTPEARQRQLRNLELHRIDPMAALRHGAYSADKLQPARERVLAELAASFPAVRRDWLEIAAAKRARIIVIQAYIDQHGVIKHRQRGEFFPVLGLLERLEVAYTADLRRIEDLARAAPSDPLADLAAEAEAERRALSDPGGTP